MNRWAGIFVVTLSLLTGVPLHAQTDLTASHPMMDAAAIGNADVVEYWLKRGVRVELRDEEGRTVLIFGAFNGSIEIVNLALSLNALVDRKDKGGNSALIWASSQGQLEVVELSLIHI